MLNDKIYWDLLKMIHIRCLLDPMSLEQNNTTILSYILDNLKSKYLNRDLNNTIIIQS